MSSEDFVNIIICWTHDDTNHQPLITDLFCKCLQLGWWVGLKPYICYEERYQPIQRDLTD